MKIVNPLYDKAWITEDCYIICLHDVPKEFEDVAKYLEGAAMDATFRRRLEAEEKMNVIFIINNLFEIGDEFGRNRHKSQQNHLGNKRVVEKYLKKYPKKLA